SAASATEYFASSSITPISDHEYEDDYDHGDNVVPSTIVSVESEDKVRDTSAPETQTLGAFCKSPTTLRRLIKQGANESIGFGSAASATEYFASSSITPISDHEYEDDYDHGDNVVPSTIVSVESEDKKAEREAALVTALCQHVSELEVPVTAKASKVVALNEKNVKLSGKVATLELVRSELDVKTGAKYVVAVSKFENVCFPSLDESEGLKDSLLALIMLALNLKDDYGDVYLTSSFSEFQPSLDQVSIHIYFRSGEVIWEMLLSKVNPSVRGSAERRMLCSPSSSATTTSLGILDY
nr:hypothetical protein [Tanacetum cinerariifolium]